jgi:hypothetical protein
MPDALTTRLASALRTRRCECLDLAHWPWKREVKCSRCAALEAYDAFIAASLAASEIIQTPAGAAEAVRVSVEQANSEESK